MLTLDWLQMVQLLRLRLCILCHACAAVRTTGPTPRKSAAFPAPLLREGALLLSPPVAPPSGFPGVGGSVAVAAPLAATEVTPHGHRAQHPAGSVRVTCPYVHPDNGKP
jgi:hypothetical protein